MITDPTASSDSPGFFARLWGAGRPDPVEVLRAENAVLVQQVHELSLYSREMALFGQLTEMLQACVTVNELGAFVAAFARSLFPEDAGTLYILDAAQQALVPQISWGTTVAPQNPFRLQDCWAVRRGKAHYYAGLSSGLHCAHVASQTPTFTFCLPLEGLGGTQGLLHLCAGPSGHALSEPRQLVAVAMAYQVALGLSNIRLKESLHEEAIRDPMTGLFNRRFMAESLEHEVRRAERTMTCLGIISFDLDHFKVVNDSLGHAAGDSLLQGIGALARESVRAGDICCRQGGDEFLLILPDSSPASLLNVAETLRQKTRALIQQKFPDLATELSLSAGVALYPTDAKSSVSLQKAADQALYRAKELGRDRIFAASELAA